MTECCVIAYRLPSGRIRYGSPLSPSTSDRVLRWDGPDDVVGRPVYRIRIKARL